MSVVTIEGLTKRFDGGTVALEGIELAIEEREFVSLIGPSGCGKSTLLRIIGDLIKPTTGTVRVNGKPAAQARADRDYPGLDPGRLPELGQEVLEQAGVLGRRGRLHDDELVGGSRQPAGGQDPAGGGNDRQKHTWMNRKSPVA